MSEVRLSVAVMAHAKRAVMVDELVGWLDREPVVVWDEKNDRHDTGIRALEAFDPAATHHLVVQDDVVPCRDLVASAERALGVVPEGVPVSLYVGRVQPFPKPVEAAVRSAGDASWVVMPGPYWGPAVIVPTSVIPALGEWWHSPGGEQWQNYDRRIQRFFESVGVRVCWYSWPSLVEHRVDDSLLSGRKVVRNAHRFIGADESGLEIDWSRGVAHVGNGERLDRRRQQLARQGAQ